MAVDTGDKVTRKYANFRGVDFRGEDCSLNRSPDALNVWRNYKKLASIETRPGLEKIIPFSKDIRCMKWYNGYLYFIDGEGYLSRWNKENGGATLSLKMGANSFFFEFEGKLFVKMSSYGSGNNDDGVPFESCIYELAHDSFGGSLVEPYIPTTSIGRKPRGGGTIHEDVNMLSPYRYNTFLGDGESKVLYLDAQDIDYEFTPRVWINDVEYDNSRLSVVYRKGWITFPTDYVLPAPETDGQDNIKVLFKKASSAATNKIMQCSMAVEFDNRVFFSGNSSYPNMVWHSSLHDTGYFSDLDYYEDGKDASPIRSLVAGNNALWVFRDTETNNGVFYHVPTLDSDYGKVYPSSHSSISLGCAGRAINFNDDIVFFSRRGMESASTDITTEQFATHKSSLVDRELITRDGYKNMTLAEWEGYLLVFIGNEVFLADSRAVLTNENHYEYEWYHWRFGNSDSCVTVACVTVHDGVLYIATKEGGVYTLTGEANKGDEFPGYFPNDDKWGERMYIDSYWTTPKDKFGSPNKLKTTNKKGCTVEATGDISVYAKIEDTDFELIDTYEDITDYFVSRIKRKKWKDIQLKFQSNTKFSLETASLEAYVGGYIKR